MTALAGDPVVVGIDIGGTSIKGVLAGRDGHPRVRFDRPTPVADGVDALVDTVGQTASRPLDAAGGPQPVGAGLVMPGVVDRAEGVARYSANIDWRNLPIRRLVAERLRLPVAVEHDARAAALAEASAGAARGLSEVLFVSTGTGLAGALVTRGGVVDGATGSAGEIGHVPVFPAGESCACGQRGCAETYASAASVSRRYAVRNCGVHVPAEVISARATGGDGPTRSVLNDAVTALARMALGAVLLADPELVVLGGGMTAAGDALARPLRDKPQAALPWRAAPAVTGAHFGGDAGSRRATLVPSANTLDPPPRGFARAGKLAQRRLPTRRPECFSTYFAAAIRGSSRPPSTCTRTGCCPPTRLSSTSTRSRTTRGRSRLPRDRGA